MKKIGKYEIIGILGKGAMGIVYKARDPVINREVAIKTVRFDLVSDESDNEEIMQRFMREAQAAGKLSHPNIITIYDVGREEDLTFIVMQLIEGQSLQRMLSSGERLSTGQIIDLMSQICTALEYAHKFGIVHRDMKPGNILLDKEEKPYICDFGVARIETSTLTQSGTAVGTPSYMSPEQVMGKKVDKRSDIFSLGCILYEMLTGRRPFEAESITTVIYKIINEQPPSLAEVKKGLPLGFERIITKALAKDASERYQACNELAADLRGLLGLSEKTIAVTVTKGELPTVVEKKKKRLAPALAVILAAVIVAGAAGAYFFIQKQKKPPVLSSATQNIKTEDSSPASQPKSITGSSAEDKLDKAKESFEKGDYDGAKKIAEEILAEDAGNTMAQQYLEKANSKMSVTPAAQNLTKEETKAEKPQALPKPKTIPEAKEDQLKKTAEKAGEEKKVEPSPPPSKGVIPGGIEDKLNRAKQSFENKDYAGTKKLAEEVLAQDPGNLTAKEYLDKADAKIKEAALIAQTLSAGISSYEKGDYEDCLRKMAEILKLDNSHKEALQYRDLADKAIYEAKAQDEIRQVIERQRRAEESKDLLLLISDIGSQTLRQNKQGDAKLLFNYHDEIKWSSISNISYKFQDRNQVEVIFSYISTAIYKKTGQRVKVFEGDRVWTMAKQENAWKIVKEEKK